MDGLHVAAVDGGVRGSAGFLKGKAISASPVLYTHVSVERGLIMSEQAFTRNPFSRRKFLQSSALSLAYGLVGAPLQAVGQILKPMAKRMPTAAESAAVRDYHAKSHGYLFEEDSRDRAAFDSRWTVYQDNRSDLLACRTAKSLAVLADGLSINTVGADHCPLGKQFGGALPAVPTGLTMHVSHVRVIGL